MTWRALFSGFRALPVDWDRTPVLIAVSGGADSLALTLAYQAFREAQGIVAPWGTATVDHRLRPASTQEAAQVAHWLEARAIPHATLTWAHGPLTTQVEERARQARYDLLTDWARQNGFAAILTAHHALDQIETVLMRATRGAGLTGLRGIAPVSERGGILLLRPFLGVFPEDLRRRLAEAGQPFVEDPSNESPEFERVRWRKALRFFGARGLDLRGVARSIAALQGVEAQLTAAAQAFVEAHVQATADGGRTVPLVSFRALLPAVGERVLRRLLEEASGDRTPCPQRVLAALQKKIAAPAFKGATAHHCTLRRIHGGRLRVEKERRGRA